MSLHYLSIIVTVCMLLASLLYGYLNNITEKNNLTRSYIIYLEFFLIIEIARNLAIFIFDTSSGYLFIIYVALEFYLLFNLFHKALQTPQKWRISTTILAGCFFVETATLWFFFDKSFTGYSKIISHLLISMATAYILVKYLQKVDQRDSFWIIYAALFLYYSMSLFLFLFMDQLTEKNVAIWAINNLLSCILYGSSIYVFHSLKHAR